MSALLIKSNEMLDKSGAEIALKLIERVNDWTIQLWIKLKSYGKETEIYV